MYFPSIIQSSICLNYIKKSTDNNAIPEVAHSKQRPDLGPLANDELCRKGSTVTEVTKNTLRLTRHLGRVLNQGSRVHTRKHSFSPKINTKHELNLFVGVHLTWKMAS